MKKNRLIFVVVILYALVAIDKSRADALPNTNQINAATIELGQLFGSYESLSFKDENQKINWLIAVEPRIEKAFPDDNDVKVDATYWLAIRMATTSRSDETIRLLKEVTEHTHSDLKKVNSLRLLGAAYLSIGDSGAAIEYYKAVLNAMISTTNETLVRLRADFVNDALLKSAQANEAIGNQKEAIKLRSQYVANTSNGETNHFLGNYADQSLLENARAYIRIGDKTNALVAYDTLVSKISTNTLDNRIWILLESINARYPPGDIRRADQLESIWTNNLYMNVADSFLAGQQLADIMMQNGHKAESSNLLNEILVRFNKYSKGFMASDKEIAKNVYANSLAKLEDIYSASNDTSNLKRLLSLAKSEFQDENPLVVALEKSVSDTEVLQNRDLHGPRRKAVRAAMIITMAMSTVAIAYLLFRKRDT